MTMPEPLVDLSGPQVDVMIVCQLAAGAMLAVDHVEQHDVVAALQMMLAQHQLANTFGGARVWEAIDRLLRTAGLGVVADQCGGPL